MTYKEKAQELYNIYKEEMIDNDAYFFESGAKKCALILSKEFIKWGTPKQKKYWNGVKLELEKL